MAYTKTNWVNDQAPAIDATNLNKIETGIAESRNVALLAVDSTAPAHCSEGDLYYNTTTKKIYEAIDTDVWDSTGVDPIGDILYIIFSTKTTYSYDGTDLVSVGGGGAEVSVSTTQPTEDEILWINPEDVPGGALNPITNEYSVAQDKGYSCNYSNEHYGGVVLYENASGSNQTINLSDSASNYDHFVIVYKNTDWNEIFTYMKYDSDSAISITGNHVSSTDRDLYTFKLTISGTTITWGTSLFSSNNGTPFAYNPFKITKVIGYK